MLSEKVKKAIEFAKNGDPWFDVLDNSDVAELLIDLDALEQENAALRAQLGQVEPIATVIELYSDEGLNDTLSVYLPVGTKLYTAPQSKPVDERELPPLPHPNKKGYADMGGYHSDSYTAKQMREYARAALGGE